MLFKKYVVCWKTKNRPDVIGVGRIIETTLDDIQNIVNELNSQYPMKTVVHWYEEISQNANAGELGLSVE